MAGEDDSIQSDTVDEVEEDPDSVDRPSKSYSDTKLVQPNAKSPKVVSAPKAKDDTASITSKGSKANKASSKSGKQPKAKTKEGLCARVLSVIFSFVGLTLLNALYAILGAYLFSYLEAGSEVNVSHKVKKTRESHLSTMREGLLENLTRLLIHHADFLVKQCEDGNGSDPTLDRYSSSGSNDGSSADDEIMPSGPWNTTHAIEIFTNYTVRKMEEHLKIYQKEIYDFTRSGWVGQETAAAWNFFTAFLYSVTISTTIGYGNIAPKSTVGKLLTVIYALIGIPLCVIWLAEVGGYMATTLRNIYHGSKIVWYYVTCCRCHCCRRAPQICPVMPPVNQRIIPSSLSVLIVFAYVALGSWLFSEWEGWTYGDAAYFSFVTLSTIGFGDYVPGFESFDRRKSVVASVYIVVGLANLSMCFQLIQEDVSRMFNRCMDRLKSAVLADKPAPAAAGKNVNRSALSAYAVLGDDGSSEHQHHVGASTHSHRQSSRRRSSRSRDQGEGTSSSSNRRRRWRDCRTSQQQRTFPAALQGPGGLITHRAEAVLLEDEFWPDGEEVLVEEELVEEELVEVRTCAPLGRTRAAGREDQLSAL